MDIRGFIRRRAWGRAPAAALCLAILSLSLAGQEATPVETFFKKYLPSEWTLRSGAVGQALAKMDELKKELADQTAIAIGGSLSENVVPSSRTNIDREPKELLKLNLNSSIEKGFYPNELSFLTDSNYQLEDGAVKENVTRLLLTYDHYFQKFLEGYVFIERFSNSYLSIQQRYEIGTGLKFETDSCLLFQKKEGSALYRSYGQTLQAALDWLNGQGGQFYTADRRRMMSEALEKMKKTLPDQSLAEQVDRALTAVADLGRPEGREVPSREKALAMELLILWDRLDRLDFQEDKCRIIQNWLDDKSLFDSELRLARRFLEEKVAVLRSARFEQAAISLAKKNAFLGLGLAFSLFSEIEKAEIREEIVNNVWETVSLPATHRLRWVIRPSFRLRPAKALSLDGKFYFKNYLWQPKGKDRRSNARQDHYLRLDYELPAALGWATSLTFFVAYEFHYDSNPPRIPEATLQDLAAKYGMAAESINSVADNKHHVLNLGIEIEF